MTLHIRRLFLALCISVSFDASTFAQEQSLRLVPASLGISTGITFESPTLSGPSVAPFHYGRNRGIEVVSLTAAEGERLRHLRTTLGSGADVSGLTVLQTTYTTLDTCGFGEAAAVAALLLDWEERLHNADGVDVFMDGEFVETVDGLDDSDGDGCAEGILPQNNCKLLNVPSGPHTFSVRSRGDVGAGVETSHVVFEEPPFCNVEEASCSTVETNGLCALSIEWTNGGPSPTFYSIEIDGTTSGSVPGGERTLDLGVVPPAQSNVITIVGIEEVDGGLYQDKTFDLECLLTCEVSCAPPGEPQVAQVAFGTEPNQRTIRAFWAPGEEYANGQEILVDDNIVGQGITNGVAFVAGMTPGEHTIGVRGDCAANGMSITSESQFDVLEETPLPVPTVGPITCRFSSTDGMTQTELNWTNAKTYAFIEVYLPGEALPRLRLPGCRTQTTAFGTTPEMVFILQFFDRIGEHLYGSERIFCQPDEPLDGNRFVRGVCDGQGGAPQLTSAVFGLNFLFLGGDQPPCRRACDTDGDGEFIISDMVNLLNFLFLGGNSPSGWTDANGDGRPDPMCEIDAEDCAVENPSCPL